MKVSQKIKLAASADTVWAYIRDFYNAAEWQPHITSAEKGKIEGERVWLRNPDGSRMYTMSSSERKIGDVWEIPYINPVATERLAQRAEHFGLPGLPGASLPLGRK